MLKQLIDAICFRLIHGAQTASLEFRICRLDLQPNDILVLRFKERITHQVADRLRADLNSRFGKDRKILILENSADLAVLTAAEIESRAQSVTA